MADLFSLPERLIFPCPMPDGSTRYMDPMEVERNMLRACRRRGIDLEAQTRLMAVVAREDGDTRPVEAHELEQFLDAALVIAPALAETFGVAPLDPATGTGSTVAELSRLYAAWIAFQSDLKKNTATSPSSSPPTDGPPSPPDPAPVATAPTDLRAGPESTTPPTSASS